MSLTQKGAEGQLRLWPGVVAVVLLWLVRYGVPMVVPEATGFAIVGELALGLAVLVWWTFFSRAPRWERWGAVALIVAAMAATPWILDRSIATGMMGMMFVIFGIPVVCLALVGWAVATRRMADGPRCVALVATILVACGGWGLLRTDGIMANAHAQLAWRWAKTAEQELLARGGGETDAPAAARTEAAEEGPAGADAAGAKSPASPEARPAVPAVVAEVAAGARAGGDWPGYRGANRDDVVAGVRIKTDWAASPPVPLWRRAVGPGWSSFAVRDGLLYTQEQRGEFEVVACYRVATGKPVWTHRDAARFWESNAGPGPRGTPALHGSRVYTFGATGILNALDAGTGAVAWTRNVASEAGAKLPEWGFSSSPLVVDDVVIVAAAGRLAAYDLDTGAPRWMGPEGGGSYSSPHSATLGGVAQVLLASDKGVTALAPADGEVLWKHAWAGFSILQPAVTVDGGVLITTSTAAGGVGTRRLAVAHGARGWSAEEVWTSNGLKPYFNDFVVHDGHAFGFDGAILSCIDLKDGTRKWKGGRYGNGQMLLLSDQGLLLVVSEEGELALVGAVPGQFTELARFPAVEGKTWNHPVLAGDTLLVRNGREMVALRLPVGGL